MGGLISFFKEVKSHITRRRINNDAVYEALLKEEYKKQNIILKNQIDELEVKQHMMEASLVLRKQTKKQYDHLKFTDSVEEESTIYYEPPNIELEQFEEPTKGLVHTI